MEATDPVAELDARFSSQGATPRDWSEAEAQLEHAAVFWVSTVRPDGRPHVTPLISVWFEGALFFCTGPDERKGRNLAQNSHCVLTTGCNAIDERQLKIRHRRDYATLVTLAEDEPRLTGLRQRGLVLDSPRVLARDRRLPRE